MTGWQLVVCLGIAAALVLACGTHAVCQASMPQVMQLAATIVGVVGGVAHAYTAKASVRQPQLEEGKGVATEKAPLQ